MYIILYYRDRRFKSQTCKFEKYWGGRQADQAHTNSSIFYWQAKTAEDLFRNFLTANSQKNDDN